MCSDLSRVADGFRCTQCDGTIPEVDIAEELMVDGETYECYRAFVIWETLFLEMVERILLLQLESEMDEVPRAFAITDIQSSPVGDEKSSVCQLYQNHHDLWK